MKKKYEKPYIAVEFFQLDAAIAASCSADKKLGINYDFELCTPLEENPGDTYLGDACLHDVRVEGDGNDTICYHGPLANYLTIYMES